MKHSTWLAPIIAIVASLVAGATSQPATSPDVEIKLVPVVYAEKDARRTSLAIEFVNRGKSPLTFITPQDGSEWGWLDPQYRFTITTKGGDPLKISPRCGNFGAHYRNDTFITVPPGESRYVFSHDLPYDVPQKGKVTATLSYTVGPKPSDAQEPSKGEKKLDQWPAGTFIGTITSKPITFDPSLSDGPPHENIGLIQEFPAPGKVESGMELTLYPALKVQTWDDAFMRLQLRNVADTPLDTDKRWKIQFSWTDAAGKPVTHYDYQGDNHYYRGELPAVLRATHGIANTQIPIGFQKTPGKYQVRATLIIDGRGQATSNSVEVEVIPNKLAPQK